MSAIREKLKNMTPEERKMFIHYQFVEIYGENTQGYNINEKKAVIDWYEQIESREERQKNYQLGLRKIQEYLETGDISSGRMVSYDDFK